jgi:NADH:ubiquinone oxidoreductase subunit F (NADH-binding)
MGAALGHALLAAGARAPIARAGTPVSAPPIARPEGHAAAAQPATLPRLLSGIPSSGTMSLDHHEAVHGPLPSDRRSRGGARSLIEQLERSGLRGRGGAGFPMAAKLRAVASSRGRPIVLVNAAEGEPASRKDRTLTRALPHLVLDGGELAAHALGAKEIVLAVCESAQSCADSLAVAIAERGSRSHGAPRARLVTVPDRFVAGQETALVNHVNGNGALPTFTPPMPFERGIAGRPTLVSNAETLAHAALIARHGARWFRALGTAAEPGSAMVTLSGPVARPGVYEIALGASLASLVEAAGGLTANASGALLGGYGGCWIGAERLGGLQLADEALAPHGASLGAGVVLLLSEHACPIAEVGRLAAWLAAQSAGQCGPCVHGLDAIAAAFQELADGGAGSGGVHRVQRLAALASGRGACRHPDGAARMVASAVDAFSRELADHAVHGRCERCGQAPELPLSDR